MRGASSCREQILGNIRRTAGLDGATRSREYAAIRREYAQTGTLDPKQKIQLFEDRLRDYEAAVYRCHGVRITETVAKALAVRGKRRLVIPESMPRDWLPNGFDFVIGEMLTHQELDHCDGVLTGCAAAIAVG